MHIKKVEMVNDKLTSNMRAKKIFDIINKLLDDINFLNTKGNIHSIEKKYQ